MVTSNNRIRTSLSLLALIVVGTIIYSNALHGPFLFDDKVYIRDNIALRDLKNFYDFSGTRFVTFLTFALNYAAGGLNSFGYHLVNIIIHILNGILVYLLVGNLFSTPVMKEGGERTVPPTIPWAVAFCAALLFIVHPLQTQAVANISQRFASLATLFYLSAVLFYVKSRLSGTPGRSRSAVLFYAIALISALLAQKTKEISYTLPAVICLVEFSFFRGCRLVKRLIRLAPFLLLFAVIPLTLFLPWSGFAGGEHGIAGKLRLLQIQEMATISRADYFLTELRIIVTYMRLIVWPSGQTIDHDYTIYHTFFTPAVMLSFIFLSVVFFFAVYLLITSRRRRRPLILLASFGVIWFFITISVESSIVPIKDAFFEHRVYLPLAGALPALCAFFFAALLKMNRRPVKRTLYGALAVVLVAAGVLSLLTYRRNAVWQSGLALWQDVVSKSPARAMGYNNLGNVFLRGGDMASAMKNYRIAARLDTDYAEPYNNMGVVMLRLGRARDALDNFNRALKIKPGYAGALNNIAMTLVKSGRPANAVSYARMALALKPGFAAAHNSLGIALAHTGKLKESIKHLRRAVGIQPWYADAYNNLGLSFILSKKYDEAVRALKMAVRLRPSNGKYRRNLALAESLMAWGGGGGKAPFGAAGP